MSALPKAASPMRVCRDASRQVTIAESLIRADITPQFASPVLPALDAAQDRIAEVLAQLGKAA